VLLDDIGVERVETHLTTFAELLPGVAAGRWAINVPLFVTPERAALVSFSRPVWALQDGFIVRAGNPKNLDSYHSLADNKHARLGVVAGQVQHEAAVRVGVPAVRISQFATQQAVVQALLDGAIDAYARTAVGNRTFVRDFKNSALLAVELNGTAQSPEAAVPVGAFSFARTNVELRKRFDAYLALYLGSPVHRKPMASYGLSAREIDPIVELGK
jgi:polar amino acid transport system substrate-binding protein